jgi:hypothetical protein
MSNIENTLVAEKKHDSISQLRMWVLVDLKLSMDVTLVFHIRIVLSHPALQTNPLKYNSENT